MLKKILFILIAIAILSSCLTNREPFSPQKAKISENVYFILKNDSFLDIFSDGALYAFLSLINKSLIEEVKKLAKERNVSSDYIIAYFSIDIE